MPYVARVAVGDVSVPEFSGATTPTPDGTGVRDYIHVVDLASGHLAALARLREQDGLLAVNLGTGKGYSVLEIVAAFAAECGR